MAVCNLFSKLDKSSGNFLLFSQYVEDITHSHTEGNNYKVVPSRFVALDIDYKDVNILRSGNLNIDLPNYFQNYFENGCAYGRGKFTGSTDANGIVQTTWNADMSKNLFWNSMIAMMDADVSKFSRSVKYWGDINMQSYNEHNGIGYNELYCYIPSDAGKYVCQVIASGWEREFDNSNTSDTLEGYPSKLIGDYSRHYYYNKDFNMSFDDPDIANSVEYDDAYYNINTIVVLYDIMHQDDQGNWNTTYRYIPMGMYVCGKFVDNELTNPVKKYVNTSLELGTSYGLRICTRFTVAPNGMIQHETELNVDSDNYVALNQLLTAMATNLNKMLEISSASVDNMQSYKDMFSSIKNNRTNVPYVKSINDVDYWFVNGRMVSAVTINDDCCTEVSNEAIIKRLENLMDSDSTNDYTYITNSGKDCNCNVVSNKELADYLGVEYVDSPNDDNDESICEHEFAKDEDVNAVLNYDTTKIEIDINRQ